MKRVSLEVAKVIKDAGYPQPQTDVWGYVNRPNNCYFTGRHSYWDENRERRLEWDEMNEFHVADDWVDEIEPSFYGSAIADPTYYEVWDWLWREKKICINCNLDKCNLLPMWWCNNDDRINYNTPNFESPEEAISDAIEYLTENDLIK